MLRREKYATQTHTKADTLKERRRSFFSIPLSTALSHFFFYVGCAPRRPAHGWIHALSSREGYACSSEELDAIENFSRGGRKRRRRRVGFETGFGVRVSSKIGEMGNQKRRNEERVRGPSFIMRNVEGKAGPFLSNGKYEMETATWVFSTTTGAPEGAAWSGRWDA